jgi:hypothetical protein
LTAEIRASALFISAVVWYTDALMTDGSHPISSYYGCRYAYAWRFI